MADLLSVAPWVPAALTLGIVAAVSMLWLVSRRWTPAMVTYRLTRSGTMPEPRTMTDRAQSFASTLPTLRGSATLLVERTPTGVSSYVSLPAKSSTERIALSMAHAVAARAERIDEPPVLLRDDRSLFVATMRVRRRSPYSGRDVQIGPADEVSRTIARVLPEGSWTAMVLRRPTKSEISRSRRWYGFWLGGNSDRAAATANHHAFSSNPLVATIHVGSPNLSDAIDALRQIAAAMPGFDLDITGRRPTNSRALRVAAIVFAVSCAGALFVGGGAPATAAFVTSAVIVGAIANNLLPTRASAMERDLQRAQFGPPRRILGLFVRDPQQGDADTAPRAGSYPLAADTALIGPALAATFVAPHSGAAAGANVTSARDVPSALRAYNGPRIGVAGNPPIPVHLTTEHRRIAILGSPGSGKSILVRLLWGFDLLDRINPRRTPGSPGASNTLVAIETKGEGALEYQRWCAKIGVNPVVINLGDPSTFAIDLFAVANSSAKDRADLFVEAMRSAFGEDAIGDRSFPALIAALTGAHVVTDEIAATVGLPGRNIIGIALAILGGQGDDVAVELFNQLESRAGELARAGLPAVADSAYATDLTDAIDVLRTYFAKGVTASNRRTFFDAPRNKLQQLDAARDWFAPERPKVSWDDLIGAHHVIIVNTGTEEGSTSHRSGNLAPIMGAMLLHTLREAIRRNCAGWSAAGRAITIFADELSEVAGANPETVTWLREQGRSYGVRLVFATQRPEQLVDKVRSSLLNFDTLCWLKQFDPKVAKQAAEDLSLGGEEWTAAEIANLPVHHAIVRTTSGSGERQSPVVVKIDWFENSDAADFIAANPVYDATAA